MKEIDFNIPTVFEEIEQNDSQYEKLFNYTPKKFIENKTYYLKEDIINFKDINKYEFKNKNIIKYVNNYIFGLQHRNRDIIRLYKYLFGKIRVSFNTHFQYTQKEDRIRHGITMQMFGVDIARFYFSLPFVLSESNEAFDTDQHDYAVVDKSELFGFIRYTRLVANIDGKQRNKIFIRVFGKTHYWVFWGKDAEMHPVENQKWL